MSGRSPRSARWSRSSGWSCRGWSTAAASSSSGGAGQASGPSVTTISSALDPARAQQLRPGALLGAELAQAQLAAVGEPDQDPRAAILERRPLVEDLQPPGGHQVDQQRQRLRRRSGRGRPTTSIFPTRRTPVDRSCPSSAASGGSTVFTATIPGVSTDSTSAPSSADPSLRAVISTSGNSGIRTTKLSPVIRPV